MTLLTALLLIATSQLSFTLAIDDIPNNYISSKPMKSLFCNACSVLSSMINDTVHEESKDFETYVGFRLDSNGKKIRKDSKWLKLFLQLEDACDEWKDKYRIAKRKNGYLYLIENEAVRAMEHIERKRKDKLEKEASDRLNTKWDKEWEIERLEQERKWNETHDEFGNLIESNDTETTQTEVNETDTESEQDDKDGDDTTKDDEENEDEKEEEDEIKRYFYEKKPKLVKKKNKQHKIAKEMCYFLNEKYDDWLHEQQKIISKQMKEGEKISQYLEALSFCTEDGICKKSMFDPVPKIFKFKKELRLPKKPKRTWQPPQTPQPDIDDYEAGIEDDVDDDDENENEDTNDSTENGENQQNQEISNDENIDENERKSDVNDNENEPKSEL